MKLQHIPLEKHGEAKSLLRRVVSERNETEDFMYSWHFYFIAPSLLWEVDWSNRNIISGAWPELPSHKRVAMACTCHWLYTTLVTRNLGPFSSKFNSSSHSWRHFGFDKSNNPVHGSLDAEIAQYLNDSSTGTCSLAYWQVMHVIIVCWVVNRQILVGTSTPVSNCVYGRIGLPRYSGVCCAMRVCLFISKRDNDWSSQLYPLGSHGNAADAYIFSQVRKIPWLFKGNISWRGYFVPWGIQRGWESFSGGSQCIYSLTSLDCPSRVDLLKLPLPYWAVNHSLFSSNWFFG